MSGTRTVKASLESIKRKKHTWLKELMITHINALGPEAENKKALLEHYASRIEDFHETKKSGLADAIKDKTFGEEAEQITLSALMGILISALIFTKEQNIPSADLLGAKAATQAAFAGAIGVATTALIDETLNAAGETDVHEAATAFKEEMTKAGFTDKRYEQLFADFVKLLHFRECLLLGLPDKNSHNMRTEFINKNYTAKNLNEFNKKDFDLANEYYFLKQLNTLFNQAFQTIHQVKHDEIHADKLGGFFQSIKGYFESEKNRQKFSQQIQVTFISNCVQFLENEMNQPGFLGAHPFLLDSLAGLLAASLVIGIVSITTIFMPVFALVCIGIVTAATAAVGMHVIITTTDALYYKRNKSNRDAIDSAIKSIQVEQKRLTTLLQNMVVTTNKDLHELDEFTKEGKPGFLNLVKEKKQALGGGNAWRREFANRDKEDKIDENDLYKRIEKLIENAHTQTETMQKVVVSLMTSPHKTLQSELTSFIHDTQNYLTDPEHTAFIDKFELLQKIKEQVLEIAGGVPAAMNNLALPDILVNFYITPVSEHGLGGLKSDLDQARRLAPLIVNHTAEVHHPYQLFLDLALDIQFKLNEASAQLKLTNTPDDEFILQGDSLYWQILGQNDRVEDRLNAANIQTCLNASFDFLCSLNKYEAHVNWNTPFQNQDQFLLYRMLLVKQLAGLADPNNMHVDKVVKNEIKTFVRIKLNYNPDIAFDDILNQSFLISSDVNEGVLKDKLGNSHLISELSGIADALRIDMAYVSSSLTPKQLIAFEASQFLQAGADQLFFGHNSSGKLIPQYSDDYYKKVNTTIESTKAFIALLKTRTILEETGTNICYFRVISNEINNICDQINTLKLLKPSSQSPLLEKVIETLNVFKQGLSVPEIPLPQTEDVIDPALQTKPPVMIESTVSSNALPESQTPLSTMSMFATNHLNNLTTGETPITTSPDQLKKPSENGEEKVPATIKPQKTDKKPSVWSSITHLGHHKDTTSKPVNDRPKTTTDHPGICGGSLQSTCPS